MEIADVEMHFMLQDVWSFCGRSERILWGLFLPSFTCLSASFCQILQLRVVHYGTYVYKGSFAVISEGRSEVRIFCDSYLQL